MNKYIIALLLALIIALFCVPVNSYQSFDDKFYVNTQPGEHYEDVAWCRANGALGCAAEYWEDDAGCEIDGDEVVIYYYNESIIADESSVYEHVKRSLTTTYLYEEQQHKGKIIFFTCTIEMRNMPRYIACVGHNDEVVCVGGNNLDKIEQYAESVTF